MIERLIEEKQTELANIVRTLVYTENKEIISKIDFNDDKIFLDPLLFAYFNRVQTDAVFSESLLVELMQSHFIEKEPLQLEGSFNQDNIAYIPNLGYYRKENDKAVKEEFEYIEGTNIEILKYEIPLIRNILDIITSGAVGEKHFYVKEEYLKENLDTLNLAFKQIKASIPTRYVTIEKCLKKVMLFLEPHPRIASKASIKAHGTLLINIRDNENNLPFFIDTIAYSTGAMIMTTILQDKKGFFKVDHLQKISPITGRVDRRNIYTIILRLCSFYAAFHCLHNYLKQEFCKDEDRKDVTQRTVFYLKKCKNDLEDFKLITTHFEGIENIFTEVGIYFYNVVENAYNEISNERSSEMKEFEDAPINYHMGYSQFMGIK